MFDKVIIKARAGDGGDGSISFRREKFVPFGGPDGGDGGRGGDVVIKTTERVEDLRLLSRRRVYHAENGNNGMGQQRHGKKGKNLILAVPVGTIVTRRTMGTDEAVVADLQHPGEQVVVARGGKGGLGNIHFTSSTNQTPHIAQAGELGEEYFITLEMRLIADVAIIGYPNVGKSSLLAAVSAARPEIASYSFTTREPILGAVEVGYRSMIVAEIPGLINGAHLNRGLGYDFLRHIVRTKIIIHLVSGTSASPLKDMIQVNSELGLFDAVLAKKPQLCAVNKIDLPNVQTRLDEFRDNFRVAGVKAFFISTVTREGITELMAETMRLQSQMTDVNDIGVNMHRKVFRPQPKKDVVPYVCKDGHTFVVVAPDLERMLVRKGIATSEVRGQLQRQLIKLGLDQALQRSGIQLGDKIRCGKLEWEW